MTDIVLLAHKLYERIEWQNVPDPVTREDLSRSLPTLSVICM